MSAEFRRYAGTIFGAKCDADGVLQEGHMDIGEVQPLSFSAAVETTERLSTKYDTPGQTVASSSKISGTSGSMTLHQMNARTYAWAVSGTATEMAIEAATGVSKTFTLKGLDEGIKLGHRHVSNVALDGSVLDTDFEYDPETGFFFPKSGGNLVANAEVTVTYDHAGQDGYKITAATNAITRVNMEGKLLNLFTNKTEFVVLDKVVIAASDEINFISEEDSDGESYSFDLTLETISGNSSPASIEGVYL